MRVPPHVVESVVGGVRLIRLSGELNEQFDPTSIAHASPARIAIFDLEGLVRVTSFGLLQWVTALGTLAADYYCFVRVMPAIVDQFNMVRAFSHRGELVSFYAPFRCTRCDLVQNCLIDLRHQFELVETLEFPEVRCQSCKEVAEFDELPELYLQHVRSMPRPQPPAAVSAVIDGNPAAVAARFHIDKDVVRPVTAFWLSGVLDERRSFRRAAIGVDGLVVVELSGVRDATDEGIAGLAEFLNEFEQGALLARVPAGMVDRLSRMAGRHPLGPAIRLVSLCLPYRCGCRPHPVLVEIDLPRLRAMAAEPGAGPRCGLCGAVQELDVPPEVLERGRALPFGEAPEPAEDYLRSRAEFLTGSEDPLRAALANPHHLLAGKYQVLRPLAGGGMGELFLVRHVGPEGFKKKLVLKRIRRDRADDSATRSMFLDEARIAARLSHVNAVQVFGLEQIGTEYFMVMEYVEGIDLAHALAITDRADMEWPFEVACRVVADICAALQAAHAHVDEDGRPVPIVNRDVSPANVLVSTQGEIKLVDFGIASAGAAGGRRGGFQGKVAYSAPEQLFDGPVDHRVDIYGAGATLYELLTLQRFSTADAGRARERARQRPPLISARRPDVPPALEQIYLRAVEPDPDRRYQTAAELGRDLEEMVHQLVGGNRASFASFMSRVMALHMPAVEVTISGTGPSRSDLAAVAESYGDHTTGKFRRTRES